MIDEVSKQITKQGTSQFNFLSKGVSVYFINDFDK